jgi:hypothetical protein
VTALDLAVLSAATVLRLALNNVTKFSGADESVMRIFAVRASQRSYSYELECRRWFDDPTIWKWPGVLRFGNIFLLGSLYRLFRTTSFRVMTSVSTAAGIATVWLAWLLAAKIAPGTETVAAALVATAPLGLHLGRRALQDAQTSALCLGTLVAALYGHPLVAAITLAFMVACKETTLTHVPPIAIFLAMAGLPLWDVALVLFSGGLLYLLSFGAVNGDWRIFWKYRKAVQAAKTDSYGRMQEGGTHRLFVDMLLLSPIAVLYAVHGWHNGPAQAFIALLLLIHGTLPVLQSVRMVSSADVMLRIAAAATMPTAMLLLALACDAAIFWKAFTSPEGIYDPVTINLVAALGMSPKLNEERLNA